jgi:hypothetical protein
MGDLPIGAGHAEVDPVVVLERAEPDTARQADRLPEGDVDGVAVG